MYFQNRHLNHECAETIKATLKTNLEALPENRHNYAALVNAYVRYFGMERVELVVSTALLKVTNAELMSAIDNFKTAVKRKANEILWDSGQSARLSFKDRMAVAQKKTDEHNRKTPPPQKQKTKSYGMEK